MKQNEIMDILSAQQNQWASLGVKSLSVFGSVARGDDRPDSDIDILVEFDGPATFNGYMNLKRQLETSLNRTVDLVTIKALRPQMAQHIFREAIPVA